MANLSERLRANAGVSAQTETDRLMIEAATILDRLTVEGLAGVMREANISTGGGYRVAPINNPEAKAIAQALLTYITVGESHD